jgi:hypothetical protein
VALKPTRTLTVCGLLTGAGQPRVPSGVLHCMVTLTNALTKLPRHRLAAMRGRIIPSTEPVKIARLGNPIVDTE